MTPADAAKFWAEQRTEDVELTTCDRCNREVDRDTVQSVDNDTAALCEACWEAVGLFCADCDEYYWHDFNDELNLCDRCVEARYYRCHDCGAWVCDGETCDCEREEDEQGNGSWDYPYSYSYRPRPTFLAAPGEQPKFYLGVELEVNRDDVERPCNFDRDWLYYKNDGSIFGDGVEAVTMPFSLAWYELRRSHIEGWLTELDEAGARSGDDWQCGMHVHVSRTAFDSAHHLFRFLRLWYLHPDFTAKFSYRDAHRLDAWASLTNMPLRQIAKDTVELAQRGTGAQPNGYGPRYTAVNLSNADTVEVRFFTGTLLPHRFDLNLRAVAGAVEFTRTIRKTYEATPAAFAAWCTAQGEPWLALAKAIRLCLPPSAPESYAGRNENHRAHVA